MNVGRRDHCFVVPLSVDHTIYNSLIYHIYLIDMNIK